MLAHKNFIVTALNWSYVYHIGTTKRNKNDRTHNKSCFLREDAQTCSMDLNLILKTTQRNRVLKHIRLWNMSNVGLKTNYKQIQN